MSLSRSVYLVSGVPLFGLAALLSGCATPFDEQATEDLRRSVIASAQRELVDARRAPEPGPVDRRPSSLSFPPERLAELLEMAGPGSYAGETARSPGTDVMGRGGAPELFRLSLEQAVGSAVANNLDVQLARLEPAINQQAVTAALAAFDWVFFADFDWRSTDTPQPVPEVMGQPVGVGASVSQSVSYTTGLRRPLTTGGVFTVSQGQTYSDDSTPGTALDPDPSNGASIALRYEQPLLRGFGSDVALSEIRLAQNAERDAVHALKETLLGVVLATERAYWDLAFARRSLLIQQRLLDRGIETRDVLERRLGVDARPAEFSDAVARVESRRAALIRATRSYRDASDALKRLINDPSLTVGTTVLLLPVDAPLEEPVTVSYLDALVTAARVRPEIARSVLAIDNSAIRQSVARNARLPLLNFLLETSFQGLDEDAGEAYEDAVDGRFVGWLLGLSFERPIGNREAEANYRAAQLARLAATVSYRRAVQDVVLDVKLALRSVRTNWQLIEQTRTSRLAATENLRTLDVLERTVASLDPEFLNLKFNRQEALAQAELEELAARVDYNVALAELRDARGTALEDNNIRFVVPDAGSAWGADGAAGVGAPVARRQGETERGG